MTYTVPKKIFTKDSVIEKMEIHFLNGDYVTIRKNEICNISITFYDNLLRHKNKLFPIARNGFVKLKIQPGKTKWESRSLYNPKEYIENRKEYIENRCIYEDSIKFIKLYNQSNWSDIIFADIQAIMEGDFLFLKFKPNDSFGPWESDNHYVKLALPSRNDIFKMRLDFENCDGIDVFHYEILDMNLVFDEKLSWNSPGYTRCIKGGSIKIKFENDMECRYFSVWTKNKKATVKDLERRICGKRISDVDICHLYLDFYEHLELTGEVLEVNSLYRETDDKQFDDYDDFDSYYDSIEYDDDEAYNEYEENPFESGYAEKLKDGSILIVFGKHIRGY